MLGDPLLPAPLLCLWRMLRLDGCCLHEIAHLHHDEEQACQYETKDLGENHEATAYCEGLCDLRGWQWG